jgi:hypothetical protein
VRFRRPSPSMLVALLALFVALGGSSYAALKLPKNSVGPKQLKKNSVTSPKVKRGSLLLSDFKTSQRTSLRGPEGPQGPQGASGDPGSARAYALVGSTGAVSRSKNVIGVTHNSTGIYCFDLTFTPDNAVASGARPGPGNFSLKTVVTTGVAPDLGTLSCVAPFIDAVAAVTGAGDAISLDDEAFFIAFN